MHLAIRYLLISLTTLALLSANAAMGSVGGDTWLSQADHVSLEQAIDHRSHASAIVDNAIDNQPLDGNCGSDADCCSSTCQALLTVGVSSVFSISDEKLRDVPRQGSILSAFAQFERPPRRS